MDAWLTFLSCDEPEIIADLVTHYTEFRPMYEHIYSLCQNMEKVMGMFSEELRIMDRNTVQLMIDDMKDDLEKQGNTIKEQEDTIKEQVEMVAKLQKELKEAKQMH